MAIPQDISKQSDREWRSLIEPLLPIGQRLISQIAEPGDSQLRQEVFKAAFSALSAGYLNILNSDPNHPDFVPFTGQFLNLLGPNPDFMYYMTPIDENGVYRLSGYRGTVHMVVVQIASGTFVTKGEGNNFGDTLSNYYLDDLHIGENGEFDVLISRTRPEGHKGDWWELKPEATNIVLRQLSYDWLNEQDARFAIERVDSPAQKPRPSAEVIERNLKQLAVWTENWIVQTNRFCKMFAEKGHNQVHFINFSADGGMPAQAYLEGLFDLKADEALILETELPEQREYWSFHLTDERWTAYDWINRHVILNGHNAKLDGDGKFRAVISPEDPGVHNWLDSMGYKRGIIQGRWHKCSAFPQPTCKVVKISEVRDHLPPDTALMSAEERDAAIRRQRKGAQLRRRW
jgi:Protein of unknown function (DUF1214)